MSDQVMTAATELGAIVPEKWSANFYEVLLEALPFNSIIDRNYEGEIQDLGDTVNISSFPQFDVAVELDEAAKADADSITVTGQQLVINKRLVKDFIVTRKAQLQSLPHMDALQNLAVYSIMRRMQQIIIDTISPSSSAPDHLIAYDSGTTLGLADILEIKELLDNANVAPTDRHMVADAPQVNDLFNITGFQSSDFMLAGGVGGLQTGAMPQTLLGFLPHMTTEADAVTYFFHRSFMTMAVQDQLRVNVYDLGSDGVRGTRVNVDLLFGLKQLDNVRVAQLG
jgi:hypothetical protein